MTLSNTDKKFIAYGVVGVATLILTISGAYLLTIPSESETPYSNQVVGIAMIVSAGVVWVFIFAIIKVKKRRR